MREAENAFFAAVGGKRIVHDGDKILKAHVDATGGQKTSDGHWHISKLNREKPIDACVAASWRTGRGSRSRTPTGGGDGGFEWFDEDDDEELRLMLQRFRGIAGAWPLSSGCRWLRRRPRKAWPSAPSRRWRGSSSASGTTTTCSRQRAAADGRGGRHVSSRAGRQYVHRSRVLFVQELELVEIGGAAS
jgi:hypothetical protein